MSHQSSTSNSSDTVRMEINGHPYYIKSKGNVPYLYDVDTHDEVGYWSSKKGQYVMFSLYNKIMKNKYENNDHSIEPESSGSETTQVDSSLESESEESESGSEESESGSEESESGSEESESGSEESESETQVTYKIINNMTSKYSLILMFVILFVYLTLQKEFQSIYFDFIFLVFLNLLNILKVFEIMNDE